MAVCIKCGKTRLAKNADGIPSCRRCGVRTQGQDLCRSGLPATQVNPMFNQGQAPKEVSMREGK